MSASISVQVRYVYVYTNEEGRRSKCHSLQGLCRKRAAALIKEQYQVRRHRCYCGRKDTFCEFDPKADHKECVKRRNQRAIRIAEWMKRDIDRKLKEHGKQLKPTIEFRYQFDANPSAGDDSEGGGSGN